ncbi:MAG: ferrous iron transporter B [Planctomycetes bacterium]|nr:ferrous iron transporter B [Planctomycetota bacterium]
MGKEKDFLETDTGRIVALIGNECVGKSTIASKLIRRELDQKTYPGTNVQLGCGRIHGKDDFLVDTPGNLSIFPENEDEDVVHKMIFDNRIDNIIFVADAKNLTKSLSLFLFYKEFNLPITLTVNMMDDVLARGMSIDIDKLKERLGTDVHTSVAIEGHGLSGMIDSIKKDAPAGPTITYHRHIEEYLRLFSDVMPENLAFSRALALALLLGDKHADNYTKVHFSRETLARITLLIENTRKNLPNSLPPFIMETYYYAAEKIVKDIVTKESSPRYLFMDKVGIWSRNISTGIPIALMALVVMYYFVGIFGAEILVDIFEGQLFGDTIVPFVERLIAPLSSEFFSNMIVGEFGLLSTGLSLAIGLVMPVLFTFYVFFGVLESSGYLPRLAILFDRLFKKMGMSGKGIIPLTIGFSCITIAILTTRVLNSQKERNIATFLLVLGIPCAPLFGVMMVLLSNMHPAGYAIIFGIISTQIFLFGVLARKLFVGKEPEFMIEIPPMRIPHLKNLMTNAVRRTVNFLKEAIPIFLFATFIVFLIDMAGGIKMLESLAEPILSGYVGLPKETVSVFLMSLIRREAGVALLAQFADENLLTNTQLVVNLLVVTSMVPCINAVLVIVKERSWKLAVAVVSFTVPYALTMGAIVHLCFEYFDVVL